MTTVTSREAPRPTGAGLLVNSFRYLWTYDTGYDPHGVLTAELRPSGLRYSPWIEENTALFDQLVERLRAIPGVEALGIVNRLPEDWSPLVLPASTEPVERGQEPRRNLPYRDASPAFFEALRIPLVEGRIYDRGEDNVAVVNETLAKELWPGESAVGKRPYSKERIVVEVVGVVRDQRKSALDPVPQPELYLEALPRVPSGGRVESFPLRNEGGERSVLQTRALVIRTSGDPEASIPTLRETMRDIDPELPILNIQSMDRVLESSLARPRLYMALFTGFGVVALILSAAGIFGVASYTVTQRSQEVGVRIALGARGLDVLRAVVGTGAVLTAGGIVVGLTAARWLTRFLEGVCSGFSRTTRRPSRRSPDSSRSSPSARSGSPRVARPRSIRSRR